MNTPPRAILSPCIGICRLAADGVCEGCHRTGHEIAMWSQMSDGQRQFFMEEVLPEREAKRT